MAVFRAGKRLHLSRRGSDSFARFEPVAGSDGVYEFSTDNPRVAERVGRVSGVTRIDSEPEPEPAPAQPKRGPGRPARKPAPQPAAVSDTATEGGFDVGVGRD